MRAIVLVLALGLIAGAAAADASTAAADASTASGARQACDYFDKGKSWWNPCKGTEMCMTKAITGINAALNKLALELRKTQADLAAEKTARMQADAAEKAARIAADNALAANITAEANARKAADAALKKAIDDEAAARQAADADLQTAIDDEAAARKAADDAIIALLPKVNVFTPNADGTLSLGSGGAAGTLSHVLVQTINYGGTLSDGDEFVLVNVYFKVASATGLNLGGTPDGPTPPGTEGTLGPGLSVSWNELTGGAISGLTPITNAVNGSNGNARCVFDMGVRGTVYPSDQVWTAQQPAGPAFNAYGLATPSGILVQTDQTGNFDNFDNKNNVFGLAQLSCTFLARLAAE